VFLLFLVTNEKQAQEDRRNKIITRVPKPLPPPDLAEAQAVVKRAAVPLVLNFSDNTHKLFNPQRWVKPVNGPPYPTDAERELSKVKVVGITNLYFTVRLETITPSESGARYGISVEQQSAAKPGMRGRRTFYLSKGDKKEYTDRKDTFTLMEVIGPPDDPTGLVLDFSDMDKPITISKDKPFQRVDGYMADFSYEPEKKFFPRRREGDKILVAGEQYDIVKITENDAVLRARNQKQTSIKYAP